MGSINWIGKPALGVLTLSLPFLGSMAQAQENAGATERFLTDARAGYPRQDKARGGGQLRRSAKSGLRDWGTGDFARRVEPQLKLRVKRGSTVARSDTSALLSYRVRL